MTDAARADTALLLMDLQPASSPTIRTPSTCRASPARWQPHAPPRCR